MNTNTEEIASLNSRIAELESIISSRIDLVDEERGYWSGRSRATIDIHAEEIE
jgi:hypothetical protein